MGSRIEYLITRNLIFNSLAIFLAIYVYDTSIESIYVH